MNDPDAYFPADEDRPGYELPDLRPGEDDVDGGDEDREAQCSCCGKVARCECEIENYSGMDYESGPYSGTHCHTHAREAR